jgi:hypothetical protein
MTATICSICIQKSIYSWINLFSIIHSFSHELVDDRFPDTQSSVEKFGSILHQRHHIIISWGMKIGRQMAQIRSARIITHPILALRIPGKWSPVTVPYVNYIPVVEIWSHTCMHQ